MLSDLFHNTPLTERQIKDLKQVIMEMGGNAIEWGNRKNAELMVRITYRIDPEKVTIIIKDQGPGFNPGALPHAASDADPIGHLDIRNDLNIREGGFGIMLTKGLVDDFRYNDKGNEVTIIKRFPRTAPVAAPTSGRLTRHPEFDQNIIAGFGADRSISSPRSGAGTRFVGPGLWR